MGGDKCDWHVWRAYLKDTNETIGLRVARRGDSAQSAFRALTYPVDAVGFERSATVHQCTKEQAIGVMHALNPAALGAVN